MSDVINYFYGVMKSRPYFIAFDRQAVDISVEK